MVLVQAEHQLFYSCLTITCSSPSYLPIPADYSCPIIFTAVHSAANIPWDLSDAIAIWCHSYFSLLESFLLWNCVGSQIDWRSEIFVNIEGVHIDREISWHTHVATEHPSALHLFWDFLVFGIIVCLFCHIPFLVGMKSWFGKQFEWIIELGFNRRDDYGEGSIPFLSGQLFNRPTWLYPSMSINYLG